ncbi:hypothetical protein ACJMK2_041721 [Sinanodonta woodiana]|uniref:Uncharacterized protein n=1 Tax=Sinanodonta woodiana TaxID=1069815 RepID=A0ABD3W6F4_SINWO
MNCLLVVPFLELLVVALATDGQTGCLFDGRVYAKGETIIIKDCLGSMLCLGNNNYGGLQAIGDVCPNKRNTGQTGCLFDGKVYLKNEKIMIGHCLAEMTCLGNNLYSDAVALGGVCPNKRSADGQTGCLFDGHVYQKGENIIIGHCLAEMTCLGNNLYSDPVSLGGQCPDKTQRKAVDGQSGCLFDGKVYAPRDEIIIPNCLGKMTCLGQNNYSPITLLNGICENKRSADGQSKYFPPLFFIISKPFVLKGNHIF